MCIIALSEQFICRKWYHSISVFSGKRLAKANHSRRTQQTIIAVDKYRTSFCGGPRNILTASTIETSRNLSQRSYSICTKTMNENSTETMSENSTACDPVGQNSQEEPSHIKNKNFSKRQAKRFLKRQEKRKAIEEGRAPKKKKPRKKDDFYSQEATLNETSYYFENGLRKVHPYYFKFNTFAKGRWYKRTLLDVFCHEFKHFPEEIFKQKIIEGLVKVNNEPVSVDYILKDNDYITHLSHRHEVPVTQDDISIVHECSDLLVVNKPSSMPCHPCGSFRHNSLIYILWKEKGYKGLKFVHRIDRLTSGLLILTKHEAKAAEIAHQVATRVVQKEYVCRVCGEFPSGPIECREPLAVLSFKLGLQKVDSSGKEAWTSFERISYNGHTSVVRCKPHTGRTHQIRVHLQYLGFPITNDPLYNSDIWGPEKGKNGDYGKSEDEVIAMMLKDHDKLKYVNADIESTSGEDASANGDQPHSSNENKHPTSDTNGTSDQGQDASTVCDPSTTSEITDDTASSSATFDPTCLDCKRQFKDPTPEELVMYLHALKYKGPDWEFETPLPAWAAEDWKEPTS